MFVIRERFYAHPVVCNIFCKVNCNQQTTLILISVLTHNCSGTVSVGLITIHPEAQVYIRQIFTKMMYHRYDKVTSTQIKQALSSLPPWSENGNTGDDRKETNQDTRHPYSVPLIFIKKSHISYLFYTTVHLE